MRCGGTDVDVYERDPGGDRDGVGLDEGVARYERQWLPVVHGRILESITTEAEDGVSATDPPARWSVVFRVKWNRTGLDLVTRVECRAREERIICDEDPIIRRVRCPCPVTDLERSSSYKYVLYVIFLSDCLSFIFYTF